MVSTVWYPDLVEAVVAIGGFEMVVVPIVSFRDYSSPIGLIVAGCRATEVVVVNSIFAMSESGGKLFVSAVLDVWSDYVVG